VNLEDIAVADTLAIVQLKNEYCHRIDSGDYAGWADLFTEEGTFAAGEEPIEGREALQSFGENVFDEQYERTAHVVTNPVVEVDGDRAAGRFYLRFVTEDPDGEVGWRHSHYEDELRRVDGEWRFESVSVLPGISP